jgi:hypothetical protein
MLALGRSTQLPGNSVDRVVDFIDTSPDDGPFVVLPTVPDEPVGVSPITGACSMGMLTRRIALAVAVIGVAASSGAPAGAALVTYTESVTASGSLGGSAFTDALVTITGTADTDDVMDLGNVFIVPTSTTVSIAGVGTATFTDTIVAVDNRVTSLAGFGNMTANVFVMGTTDPAFLTYDLRSPIGPISGPVGGVLGPSATTLGALAFTSTSGNSTFTAVTAVPEPSSAVLMGAGVVGMLGYGWRRRRRVTAVA